MEDRAVVEQGINWVMAFVAGVVAIGFGIYLFTDPGNATALIVGIVSFALLLGSLIHLLQGLRRHANEFAARAAILSGGVGVTVGAIVTLDLFYDYLDDQAARVILASGLIVYGILGLAGMLVQRVEGTIVRTIVTCVFALAFAALLLYYSQDDQLSTRWFGVALVVTGLLLLALGYFARNHQTRLLARRGGGTSATGAVPAGGTERKPVERGATPAATGRRGAATATPTLGSQPRPDEATGRVERPKPVIAQPAATTVSSGHPGQDTRDRLLDRESTDRSDQGTPTGRSQTDLT